MDDLERLMITDFGQLKVSTRTYLLVSNIKVNLSFMFDNFAVDEDVVLPKRRRRKIEAPATEYPPSGTIVGAKFGWKIRGIDVKRRSKVAKNKSFRNSVSISMVCVDKILNLKFCSNGSIQCTGCRTDEQLDTAVRELWDINRRLGCYEFSRGDFYEVLYVPVMRNVDFKIGFNVDREKLLNLIEGNPAYKDKMIVSNYMYTDVNIKIKIDRNIEDIQITKMRFKDGEWERQTTTYREYLSLLSERDREAKLSKEYYVTFMVFHSGTIILTAINEEYAREAFYYFLGFLNENKRNIREMISEADDVPSSDCADL